jgi:sugar phosphate isomerase/epimerase
MRCGKGDINLKIGAQLYTVRKYAQTADDLAVTIKKIAAMGYESVQVSGVGPIPAAEVARICNELNIEIVITHTGPGRIKDDTDAVIAEHKLIGAGYVGIGSMPGEYLQGAALDGVKRFVADFSNAAEKIKAAGLKLMYHNHAFEFEKIDGKLMYEHIADGFGSDALGFTMDTFWVQAGGGDPAHWLRKLAGRVDVIHIKDYAIVKNDRRMAVVLEGNLNWPAIKQAAEAAGVKYAMVEQDDCYGEDEFECLKRSLENWKRFTQE